MRSVYSEPSRILLGAAMGTRHGTASTSSSQVCLQTASGLSSVTIMTMPLAPTPEVETCYTENKERSLIYRSETQSL